MNTLHRHLTCDGADCNSHNLFEAQARRDAAAASGATNVQPISKLEAAKLLLPSFTLDDCREYINAMADHVAGLEGVAFGLEDVSEKMADAIADNEAAAEEQDALAAFRASSGR